MKKTFQREILPAAGHCAENTDSWLGAAPGLVLFPWQVGSLGLCCQVTHVNRQAEKL